VRTDTSRVTYPAHVYRKMKGKRKSLSARALSIEPSEGKKTAKSSTGPALPMFDADTDDENDDNDGNDDNEDDDDDKHHDKEEELNIVRAINSKGSTIRRLFIQIALSLFV
jgi:hypothetical protein